MATNDPKKPTDKKPVPPSYDIPVAEEVGGEAFIDFGGVANIHEGASGVIPIADLPDPPSGQSLTSWTEVIRRQRSANVSPSKAAAEADSFQFDSPSDLDLIGQLQSKENKPTDEIPISELPVAYEESDLPVYEDIPPPMASPANSGFDLAELLPPMPIMGPASGGSEIRFEIQSPPSDAGGMMPMPKMELPPIDLHSDAKIEGTQLEDIPFEYPAELADIGTNFVDPGSSDGSRSSILDVLLSEAALTGQGSNGPRPQSDILNYGTQDPPRPFRSTHSTPTGRSANPTQPSFEFPSSPELPPMPNAPLASWNTPIPEDGSFPGFAAVGEEQAGSDEAVDLYADDAPIPSISDSGTLEVSAKVIEEAERRTRLIESSAVDLSSKPSFPGSEFDMSLVPKQNSPSEDDIDLSLPPVDDEASSSIVRPRAELDNDPRVLTKALDKRRQAASTTPATPHAAPSVVPGREFYAQEEGRKRTRKGIFTGTAIGLLLGAGGFGAAWYTGALPNERKDALSSNSQIAAVGADLAPQLAAANQRADDAKKQINDLSVSSGKLKADLAEIEGKLAKANETAEKATSSAVGAKQDLELAKQSLTVANTKLTNGAKELADAKTAADTAKLEASNAKKVAEESMASIVKQFKDAGIDPSKMSDAVKTLVDAKLAAEKKEKELAAKVDEGAKKMDELAKAVETAKKNVDDAKKSADEAVKAKEANDALVKSVSERLEKAKFVASKTDSAGLLKGLEEALKAGTTDSTKDLRDELVKTRESAKKMEAELAVSTSKASDAAKAADTAKTAAAKATAELKETTDKLLAMKADNDTVRAKTESLQAKADEAAKAALSAKKEVERAFEEMRVAADKATRESNKLKADNDALARENTKLKDNPALVRSATGGNNVLVQRVEETMIADKFYGEGVIALREGNIPAAQKAFAEAIVHNDEDARYHYLLGIAVWLQGNGNAANAEFEKGRRLEIEGKPNQRIVNVALERIQGAPRQALNAFRP